MKKVFGFVLVILASLLSLAAWLLKRKLIWVTEDHCTETVEDDLPVNTMDEEKYEDISLAKHDKPFMTKSQIISLLTSLATLATAIIAYMALNESILQRESMYRPELYIGETRYLADISDINHIKYYQIINDSVVKEKVDYAPSLKINNIGMGTALNVDGTAKIGWESSSPLLSKLKMPRKKGILSSENVFKHGKDSFVLPIRTSGMHWKTDYIMPMVQTDYDYTEDFLSSDFGILIRVSSWLMELQKYPIMYFTIPVKLKYKDINNKWYIKETEILIKIYENINSKDKLFITICSGQSNQEFYKEMKEMLTLE